MAQAPRFVALGVVLLSGALLAGCGASPPPVVVASMTPQLIASKGMHTFAADEAHTFDAAEGALKTLGYEIAFSNKEEGILKTKPKALRTEASSQTSSEGFAAHGLYSGESNTSTSTVTFARAYALKLTEHDGTTVIEAIPKVFANGNDISSQEVWELDGAVGEYALWNQLFSEIASNLGMK